MTRLKAGFLNMMADKALIVSECHFATLSGAVHGPEVDHRDLDVLAISGAYVFDLVLERQVF